MADLTTLAGRIVFLRKGLGLTQEEFTIALAELLRAQGDQPVTRGAVGNWEKGKQPATTNQFAIAELADVPITWLSKGRGEPPSAEHLRRRGEQLLGAVSVPTDFPLTIPVHARVAGAMIGDRAGIIDDLPVIGWLPALPGLAGLRDVYGLEVTEDSMIPMYPPGSPIYVSPHTPVRKGDPVVIIEHRSRNGKPLGFIKIFDHDYPDRVTATQLNPVAELTYSKANGLTVHRVLRDRELIGYSGIEHAEQPQAPVPARRKARR